MRTKKIYIASPYTIGDVAVNVKRQIDTANDLMNAGFSPFVPLLCHFQHMAHPRDYESWMDNGLLWLEHCDAVLRLDGESKGADIEVQFANDCGIPVYFSFNQLLEARKTGAI